MPDQLAASRMAGVIDNWRDFAVDVRSHTLHQVAGHAVAWWFDEIHASTREFMEALASDNRLVVPGAPDESELVTRFLLSTRPMGGTLGADAAIIREWIAADCPIPD